MRTTTASSSSMGNAERLVLSQALTSWGLWHMLIRRVRNRRQQDILGLQLGCSTCFALGRTAAAVLPRLVGFSALPEFGHDASVA